MRGESIADESDNFRPSTSCPLMKIEAFRILMERYISVILLSAKRYKKSHGNKV